MGTLRGMAPIDSSDLYGDEHVRRYRETDGEDGHDWRKGTSTLLLTTTGRRSPASPAIPPLIYGRSGDDYLLVASNGGTDPPPGWYSTSRRSRTSRCRCCGDRFPARARTATAEERPAMWAEMTSHWPAYDDYQQQDRPRDPGRRARAGGRRRDRLEPPQRPGLAHARARPASDEGRERAAGGEHRPGAERVAQRPGQHVADREQDERAHPVVRRTRARACAAGCARRAPSPTRCRTAPGRRRPAANGGTQHRQRRAEREQRPSRPATASVHRKPTRIGCSGRQRKPSSAPSTVPAPIAAASRPNTPALPYSSSAIVGPSVVHGPNDSSSATRERQRPSPRSRRASAPRRSPRAARRARAARAAPRRARAGARG